MKLQEIQIAARQIEADGVEAYQTVSSRFGEEVATALLVMFLRTKNGSINTWPAPREIDGLVETAFQRNGLI